MDSLQYTANSPILLSAGVLWHDMSSDRQVIQLKFKNVSSKTINTVHVKIQLFNKNHAPIQKEIEYIYDNLSAQHGGYFGDRKAIIINVPTARSFQLTQVTVTFEDDTTTTIQGFKALPDSITLLSSFKDNHLTQLYQQAVNASANYSPQEANGLWQCTCGEWNDAQFCTRCDANKDIVFSSYKQIASENPRQDAPQSENMTQVRSVTSESPIQHSNTNTNTREIKTNRFKKAALIIFIVTLMCLVAISDELSAIIGSNAKSPEYTNALNILTQEDISKYSDDEVVGALSIVMSECAHNRLNYLISPPQQLDQQYYQDMIDAESDLLSIDASILPDEYAEYVLASYQSDIEQKQKVLNQYSAETNTDWSNFVNNFDWHKTDITQAVTLYNMHQLEYISLSDIEYKKCASYYLEAQITVDIFGDGGASFEMYNDNFVQVQASVINDTDVSFSSFVLYTYWNEYTAENHINKWEPNATWEFTTLIPYSIIETGNVVIGIQAQFEDATVT